MPRGVYVLRKNTGVTVGQLWPEDVIETCKAEIAKGTSFVKLVPVLFARHGFVTTKNAIAGKMSRLKVRAINRMNNAENVKAAHERRKQDRRAKPARSERTPFEKPVMLEEFTRAQMQGDNPLLREEGDRAKGHGDGYRRKHKLEEIAEARKGRIVSVVEAEPVTSKPFSELRKGECRWPTSVDCTSACGAPGTIGSYCDRHAMLAYRTMPTRRRNATITKVQDTDRDHQRARDREADLAVEHYLERRLPMIASPAINEFSAIVGMIIEEDEDEDD